MNLVQRVNFSWKKMFENIGIYLKKSALLPDVPRLMSLLLLGRAEDVICKTCLSPVSEGKNKPSKTPGGDGGFVTSYTALIQKS